MGRTSILLVVLTLGFFSGCGGFGNEAAPGVFTRVPEFPTYDEHIGPLMERYCNDCHDETFDGSDRYVSTRYDTEGNVQGVFDSRDRLIQRTILQAPSPMPPEELPPVGTIDLQIMELWVENGAPRSP